ncbi:hypothetical protein [Micromonospora arborensis]|uniref:hypothetical protein n=1 Tax=Micromonospora arborensis TaxID=2116518 RepID=UPI003713B4C4
MTSPNESQVQHRPRGALRPHLPMRPLWLCRVCAAAWPCPPGRLLLTMEYRRDRVALSVYMASQLFDATADLIKLNPNPAPTPAELFDRFLGCTAPKAQPATGPAGP